MATALGPIIGGDDGQSWDDDDELRVQREWVRRAYRVALNASRRSPHGVASCEQIEAAGESLAHQAGAVVDVVRAMRHDGTLPRALLDVVDGMRGPLHSWRSVGTDAEQPS